MGILGDEDAPLQGGLLSLISPEQRDQAIAMALAQAGGSALSGPRGMTTGQALGSAITTGVPAYFQNTNAMGRQNILGQQFAGMKDQGTARSTLFGGPDPRTGISWNSGRPDMSPEQQQQLLARAYPDQYGKAMLLNQFPGAAPANVREYQFVNQLSPEEQARYLTIKRSNPYLNLGDQMVQPNPIAAGQTMGSFQKGIPPQDEPALKGAQAAATVTGQTQATAAMDLPRIEQQGQYSMQLIDKLVNHPGMKDVVGMPESVSGTAVQMTGRALPATDAADFKAILDQVGGQNFLEAFNTLKGGGQITEAEGNKATDAISRLQKIGQSETAYREAAQELKEVLQRGMDRARQKAGGFAPPPSERKPSRSMAPDPLGIR